MKVAIENIRKPEIKIKELLILLESIQWKTRYVFKFNRTRFQLFINDSNELAEAEAKGTLKEEYGEPAEFFKSTAADGWDIYLHDTIPKENRKRILFNEILECNILGQGFPDGMAHIIALEEEEKNFGKRKN